MSRTAVRGGSLGSHSSGGGPVAGTLQSACFSPRDLGSSLFGLAYPGMPWLSEVSEVCPPATLGLGCRISSCELLPGLPSTPSGQNTMSFPQPGLGPGSDSLLARQPGISGKSLSGHREDPSVESHLGVDTCTRASMPVGPLGPGFQSLTFSCDIVSFSVRGSSETWH